MLVRTPPLAIFSRLVSRLHFTTFHHTEFIWTDLGQRAEEGEGLRGLKQYFTSLSTVSGEHDQVRLVLSQSGQQLTANGSARLAQPTHVQLHCKSGFALHTNTVIGGMDLLPGLGCTIPALHPFPRSLLVPLAGGRPDIYVQVSHEVFRIALLFC